MSTMPDQLAGPCIAPPAGSRVTRRGRLLWIGLLQAVGFLSPVACRTEYPFRWTSKKQPGDPTLSWVIGQMPASARSTDAPSSSRQRPVIDLPSGSRIVLYDPSRPAGDVRNLTPGFDAAGRPDLSFDGQRLLFVGRRSPREVFNVWELSIATGRTRQLTGQQADCGKAIYLSSFYSIGAESPVDQICFASQGLGGVSALYTCRLDGSHLRQITFDPYGAFDPCALDDGRLLFRMWRRAAPETGSTPERSIGMDSRLMTIHVDGTDVSAFPAAGKDPARSSIRAERTSSLPGGQVISAESADPYGAPRRLFDTPEWDEVDAVAVAPRRRPAGRSSAVDDRKTAGRLYCLNANISDEPNVGAVEAGQIRFVRVIRAVSPSCVGADAHQAAITTAVQAGPAPPEVTETILGQAPVEADGSFYLDVPARTPLRFETLDVDGRVLRAMSSWIWIMPHEARGCIGCHENRALTPPNRHVLALRKGPHSLGVLESKTIPGGGNPLSYGRGSDPGEAASRNGEKRAAP